MTARGTTLVPPIESDNDRSAQNSSRDSTLVNNDKMRLASVQPPTGATTLVNVDDQPTPSRDYGEVYHQAATHRQAIRRRQPQQRKRWADDEADTLIQLIGVHGTEWAVIKQTGIFGLRDQVQLKDKAINIKMVICICFGAAGSATAAASSTSTATIDHQTTFKQQRDHLGQCGQVLPTI